MNKILDGKNISNELKDELKVKINSLDDRLRLVVIQVGDNESSNIYIRNKEKICNEINISFEHLKYENIDEEDLLKEIDRLNSDTTVTSILVQLPLPDYLNEKKIIERIDYKKDVDGLTSTNIGKLYNGEASIKACTAYGIMKLFDYYDIPLEGKKVTIIGRSTLVGIPLFKLLLDKNCTVTMCHSKTNNIKNETINSDIIVVAVGKKDLLTEDMIKENAILIDVGINRNEKEIYGDINSNCYDKCLMYTPVPGGVGPMTVVMLINNILECYELQKKLK